MAGVASRFSLCAGLETGLETDLDAALTGFDLEDFDLEDFDLEDFDLEDFDSDALFGEVGRAALAFVFRVVFVGARLIGYSVSLSCWHAGDV